MSPEQIAELAADMAELYAEAAARSADDAVIGRFWDEFGSKLCDVLRAWDKFPIGGVDPDEGVIHVLVAGHAGADDTPPAAKAPEQPKDLVRAEYTVGVYSFQPDGETEFREVTLLHRYARGTTDGSGVIHTRGPGTYRDGKYAMRWATADAKRVALADIPALVKKMREANWLQHVDSADGARDAAAIARATGIDLGRAL